MSDDTPNGLRRARICVFRDRPDTILIHVSDDATEPLSLPQIPVPFTKAGVAKACADHGMLVSVIETIPGRWTTAMITAKATERGERAQAIKAQTALTASVLRGSVDPTERDRAALVQRLAEANERGVALKQKIAVAKSEAASRGVYMDPKAFRALERRLDDTKKETLAIQGRLAAIKQERRQRAETSGQREEWAREFVKAAKRILDAETFEDIVGEVDSAQDDGESRDEDE